MRYLACLITLGLSLGPVHAQYRDAPQEVKTGKLVEWEGWSFRWAMRNIEGLVLTDVHFRGRQVLRYAGLAEIFVPYDDGEQRPIDFEDDGFGKRLLTLQPGVDCASGNWCKAFDAKGNVAAAKKPAVVMMHEENLGPSYLGTLGRTPGKMLVLWAAALFPGGEDGYTYILRWKFRSDGTLIPELGATGVPQFLKDGDSTPYAPRIGKKEDGSRVRAPAHVHTYLFRLDFAVDGPENDVEEFNWAKENGSKARGVWSPIRAETGRLHNADTFRSWRVLNRRSLNAMGRPRSYQLMPAVQGVFRGKSDEKATFADVWITRAKAKEQPYTKLDPRTALAALPDYVNGESVEGTSIVLWHWVAFHHQPRTEDYRHQPVVWKSFELMPRDFLDQSPLDGGN